MPCGSWFDTLTHPRVRDLAWSLICPPLHRFGALPPPGFEPDGIETRMLQLDRCPAPLETFLAGPSIRRLGLYHERLLQYYLGRHDSVSELQRGVPVRHQGITLGELDFLYRMAPLPGFIHLEVAFKFFLRFGNQWLGIDPRDSLDRKVARMENHQLPLSASETFQAQSPQRVVDHRLGWIKGCLFEPWQERRPHAGDCWQGWWLYADQVRQLPPGRYLPLERSRWLSPAREADESVLVGVDALGCQDFSRARMVACMAEGADGWQETGRGLVMPRRWPES